MAELTLKSAKSLFNKLGQTIMDIEINTDKTYQYIIYFEKLNIQDKRLLNILNASLQFNFIYLDFCTVYRLYLAGLTHYEQRFAIKQLYIILNEGFKRIYGFDHKNDLSQLSTTRRDSIWKTLLEFYKDDKDIIVKNSYLHLLSYLQLFKDDIIFDQSLRSHGVHYHKDFRVTYDFLNNLDAEKVTHGALHFMDLMNEIRNFISIVTQRIINGKNDYKV